MALPWLTNKELAQIGKRRIDCRIKREIQLHYGKMKFTAWQNNPSDSATVTSVLARRQLANVRNMELKLDREKTKMAPIRKDMISSAIAHLIKKNESQWRGITTASR